MKFKNLTTLKCEYFIKKINSNYILKCLLLRAESFINLFSLNASDFLKTFLNTIIRIRFILNSSVDNIKKFYICKFCLTVKFIYIKYFI